MTGENIVACPACGEPVDAVAVVCETGRCPHEECGAGLGKLFANADGEHYNPRPEDVAKHYELEADA